MLQAQEFADKPGERVVHVTALAAESPRQMQLLDAQKIVRDCRVYNKIPQRIFLSTGMGPNPFYDMLTRPECTKGARERVPGRVSVIRGRGWHFTESGAVEPMWL